jgi:hypothetical protein
MASFAAETLRTQRKRREMQTLTIAMGFLCVFLSVLCVSAVSK